VGRKEPSDLIVRDHGLSSKHARFTLTDGRIFVEDLNSTNGTWIAGTRIERDELEFGGEVMLGPVLVQVFAFGTAVDPAVIGKDRFRNCLEAEAQRAQYTHQRFAVLAVRASEREGTRASGGAWAARLTEKLRSIDRVSLYRPHTALVLLPEMGSEAAQEEARRIASASSEDGGPRLVGVAVYPEAASTVEPLIELAVKAADRATTACSVVLAPTAASVGSSAAGGSDEIIAGKAQLDLLKMAKRAAAATGPVPVVLHGESGTGKEVLARFIHQQGPRRNKPMVPVNCGAIPPNLVESTLFGHEKGAFTGASKQHQGVFEQAHQGILFLDEIGELPLDAQAKLLRVLETGRFFRVGGKSEIAVDVQVIAATHRDLFAMVKEESFREDLYYRLSVLELEIPPLRDRLDEMDRLVERFLVLANEAFGQGVRGVTEEAMARLRAYTWPGNVRELRNIVERAVLLARGPLIGPEDLSERVVAGPSEEGEEEDEEGTLKGHLRGVEARKLEKALQQTGWKRAEAATLLGMSLRTFSRKVKDLGIEPPKTPKTPEPSEPSKSSMKPKTKTPKSPKPFKSSKL
jgi:DNA-binding NtrC family response regulator